MKTIVSALLLVGSGLALVGCGSGEQTAPKPDPAQFAPKTGGPSDGPNAAPKTP